jgi:Tol biopolymer transport system component
VLSADGRYVLFASTANNLTLTASNAPIPSPFPASLNVFVRDRTNATTRLVSVNLTGLAGGDGDSLPADISTNGRYVAFESSAGDLVAGDTNNASDVFVRDLVNGATSLVSVSTNGGVGNGASRTATMTPDGRYIAFVSTANNLVSGDTNTIADVFVRDLWAGTTTLASVGARATNSSFYYGTTGSDAPQLTPDGRYVAFCSATAGLVPGVTSVGDIYLRDLVAGITYWASSYGRTALQNIQNTQNGVCYNHCLSADGQYVAYEVSQASGAGIILRYNLGSGITDVVNTNAYVPLGPYADSRSLDMTPDGQHIVFIANTNDTTGTNTCVCVWDAQSGMTTLASANLSNAVPVGSTCDWPAFDSSGRFVAFLSNSTNMVTNLLSGFYHLYLRDLQAGTTTLLDSDTSGVGTALDAATMPRLSADGQFAAFACVDSFIVANDRTHNSDVFVRDAIAGTSELISLHDPGLPSATGNGPSYASPYSVSTNAHYIAFASEADNLVEMDTNGVRDVFLCDLDAGTNVLVSVSQDGFVGNGVSTDPAISGDGRYVAFTSAATNLVSGDTNNALDVFVRDLQAGTTTLVSINATGTGPGNADSYSPVINADGGFVYFRSKASNLRPGGFSGENLFVRDLVASTTTALTTAGVSCSATSADGRFVALVDTTAASLYVWDSQVSAMVFTNSTAGLSISAIGISLDGQRIAYSSATQLYMADRSANTSGVFLPYPAPLHAGLRFSSNGQFVVCAATVRNTNQVYLYDFLGGTNLLASQGYASGLAACGNSDSPDISPDGRFVAYRSDATNLVAGDSGNGVNVFLFDRQSGATTLLSASLWGNAAADRRSVAPIFSRDGQTLVFQSWATDLTAQDFNQDEDLFAYSLYYSGAIPVFYARMVSTASPGQRPTLTWPALSGKSYRVQFKNSLNDANWQDAGAGVSILGTLGQFSDPAPASSQRFYRIVAF